MFFLGLLSSPIPYLLLAGFYFLGFAVGMFKNDQAVPETTALAVVSIQADIQTEITEKNTIYVQIHRDTPKCLKSKLPNVRYSALHINHNHFIATPAQREDRRPGDPEFTDILFSRPPPAFSV